MAELRQLVGSIMALLHQLSPSLWASCHGCLTPIDASNWLTNWRVNLFTSFLGTSHNHPQLPEHEEIPRSTQFYSDSEIQNNPKESRLGIDWPLYSYRLGLVFVSITKVFGWVNNLTFVMSISLFCPTICILHMSHVHLKT